MKHTIAFPRYMTLLLLLIALLLPTMTAHATAPNIQLLQVQNDGTTVTLIGSSDTADVSDLDILFANDTTQYSLRDDADGSLNVDANGVLTATLSSVEYQSFFPTGSAILDVTVVNALGEVLFSGSINGAGGGGVGVPQ